jgi:hypothetical protein
MGLDVARLNVEWSRVFPKPMPEPFQGSVEVRGDAVVMVDVDEGDLMRLWIGLRLSVTGRYLTTSGIGVY